MNGETHYYLFALGKTVVKTDGSFWYQRNKKDHVWVVNFRWSIRFIDAGYDVVEIEYNEETETILNRKRIEGFWSINEDSLLFDE